LVSLRVYTCFTTIDLRVVKILEEILVTFYEFVCLIVFFNLCV
jgi:hypothetical protein